MSLYGIYPASERPIQLEPALTWKTRVGWIGTILESEGVSYGLKYKAPRETRVAMVQAGYGDGYPRALSGVGEVLIGGGASPNYRKRLHGCERGAFSLYRYRIYR